MRRIAILMIVLAFAAAACGDDEGSVLGGSSTTAASTETTAAGTATTSASTEAPTTTAGGSGGDIQAALTNYETAAFRAVYRFGEGDDEQIITISRDPNLDPPASATLIGENGADGRFLTLGDRTLICGPPGEDCLEFPSEMGMDMGAALLGPLLSSVLLTEDIASTPGFTVEQNQATIGGRAGLCFTFSPTALVTGADVEYVRQCVDAELGFILLYEYVETGGAAAQTIMELIEFSDPAPADFEASGPVTTMPGG